MTMRISFGIVLCSLLAVSSASATTRNWEGDTSAFWATAGNWDTAPANSLTTDIANFNLAVYGGNPVYAPTVGTATSINGLTIGASNGSMTLTHTAVLSIGSSGITIANGAGAFTISGSTTLGASQSWLNNSANLFTFGAVTTGGNTLTIGGSGTNTASGIISGTSGALTKEGTGLLTLNAANTYTGATTVNGGELRWGINNAIAAGDLTINNGGTVNMQTFSDTVGTITIANGGTITGITNFFTTGSGGFISNDGGTINGFNALAGLKISGGLTYNSTGPGSTTLQIDRVYVNELSTTVFNIANGDATVDFEITQQLVTGSGNNSSRTIRKTGPGVMQLSGSGANYTTQNYMPLEIWDGTLIFNKSAGVNAISSNSGITIGDGIGAAGSAILQLNESNQVVNAAITINSDGLFKLNGKTYTTYNALTLNGAAQISIGGSGTLTLGNDLTFNAAGNASAQITGSVLALGGANRTFTVGLGAGSDYDLLVGAGISGARSLTKTGTGRLVLTGSNSYTLGTTVNAGTLQIGDGTTAGTMTSTGALTLGNATFVVRGPASGGSTQTVASLTTSANTMSTIKLTPGTSGNTTLTITSNTPSTGAGSSVNFDYTAGTTVGGTIGNNYVVWSPTLTAGIIGGAYTVTDSGGTGFATISGGKVVRVADSGSAGLPVSGGSATVSYFVGSGYSTNSTTTPGSLVEALAGAVAANNVTVDTTGLVSGANLALGENLLTLGGGMVISGPNPYEISGSGAGGLKAATSGGTIYLNNGNTGTVTISAPIVANGASSLVINGTGTTILSGVNTYSGVTTINGGTLRLDNQLALQNSTLTMNGGNAALVFDSTVIGNAFTFGGLAASSSGTGYDIALQNNATTPAAIALTVGGNNASTTYAGVLSGSGSLIKTGTGTLTLSGVNTYTGGTFINGGTLTMSLLTAANLGGTGANITFDGTGTLQGGYGGAYSFGSLAIIGASTTASLSGGSGSGNYMTFTGPVTGSGTLKFYSSGNGYASTLNFNSTANTCTGPILYMGNANNGVDTINVNSLGDGVGAGSLQIGANNRPGSQILNYGSGAIAPLTLNYRQIAMGGTSCGATFNNNATNVNCAVTVNTALLIVGTGAKTFTLGGSNTNNNTFAGAITNGAGSVISLTKANAGKWILSGNNTFSGTTTVSAGTLVLAAGTCLSDTNILTIASGAKLQLEAGVKEKVGFLTLNATPSVPVTGTWGSTASRADNKNDTYFSGTGVLYVGVDFPPSGTLIFMK